MTTSDSLIRLLLHIVEQTQRLEQMPMHPTLRKFIHASLLSLTSAVAYAAPHTIVEEAS